MALHDFQAAKGQIFAKTSLRCELQKETHTQRSLASTSTLDGERPNHQNLPKVVWYKWRCIAIHMGCVLTQGSGEPKVSTAIRTGGVLPYQLEVSWIAFLEPLSLGSLTSSPDSQKLSLSGGRYGFWHSCRKRRLAKGVRSRLFMSGHLLVIFFWRLGVGVRPRPRRDPW